MIRRFNCCLQNTHYYYGYYYYVQRQIESTGYYNAYNAGLMKAGVFSFMLAIRNKLP